MRDGLASLALLVRLPKRIDSLVTRAEMGQLTVRNPEMERRISGLTRAVRRVISTVLFGVFFISGLIVLGTSEAWGITLLVVSGIPLLHALYADVIARRGPLP